MCRVNRERLSRWLEDVVSCKQIEVNSVVGGCCVV